MVVESVMGWRHLCGVLGSVLAVLGLANFVLAAALDLTGPKETTKNLTARNVSALMDVSTAVPEELHLEVIEFIQVVETSRERIILVLDRIESGLYPSKEGMERARTIATTSAQREKEFLQALMDRVPAQSVPKLEEALTVSAESWKRILAVIHLPKQQEERGLPQRPGFDFSYSPIPTPPPPRE
jgi:hypothetical protein